MGASLEYLKQGLKIISKNKTILFCLLICILNEYRSSFRTVLVFYITYDFVYFHTFFCGFTGLSAFIYMYENGWNMGLND